MERMSIGLCNKLLDTNSFKTLMDGGSIRIFKGTPLPVSASAAETGTLICIVKNAGVGIIWGVAGATEDGVMAQAAAQVWSGTVINSGGVATYYRVVGATDTGVLSTTEPRVQGTIGTSASSDMQLADPVLVAAASFQFAWATQQFVPS